jgi:peptidoglycan hydrolase-like protein with peptidoglycan-binding domain
MHKKLLGLLSLVVLSATVSLAQAQEATADTDAALQPLEVVVNTKMVKAVQSALIGRGFYRSRPNGVLDAETRDSIRSFQSSAGLDATGRINPDTLEALEIDPNNPAVPVERRSGFIPAVGYTVKDGAVKTKDTVVGGAKYVGRKTRTGYDTVANGTKTGLNKTKDVTTGAFRKSKDVTVGVGNSASDKMGRAGKKGTSTLSRASTAVVGRTDTDINLDIRDILDDDTTTNAMVTSVKRGAVSLELPQDYQGDVSPTLSRIRKVPGVKSVVVVQQ